MANLLDQASIVLTPTAYDNGKVLCAKPSEPPYGDFDFSRNSAATRVNAQGLVENVQILSSNLVQNGDFSEEGSEEVSNGSFSQEGVEKITNGDFSSDTGWIKGTGWTISGGSLNGSSSTSSTYQNNSLVNGTMYKATYTVSNYVSGSVQIKLGGSLGQARTANGTYTEYLTATQVITWIVGNNFTGSIDNCSVREVGQDWTLGTGWSIGEDKAISDGSDTSVSGWLRQNNILTAGKTYTFSCSVETSDSGLVGSVNDFYVKFLDIDNGSGEYTATFTAVGTGFAIAQRAGKSFSITNISVKEVGQNWELDSANIEVGKLTLNSVGGAMTYAYQIGLTLVANTSYLISLNATRISGDTNLAFGSTGVNNVADSPIISTSGIQSYNFTPTTNVSNFGLKRNAGGSGAVWEVTNISVIEITDDTNLPRINYEGFSYQDALGSELVVNGTFDDGLNGWSTHAGSTLELENGMAKVTTVGGQGFIKRTDLSIETGKTYFCKAYITNALAPQWFINSVNNPITLSLISENTYGGYVTTTGNNPFFYIRGNQTNGEVSYIDNVSVKEYLGQSVVPESGCGSWLFEPASRNLIRSSQSYTSNWGIGDAVITENIAISPDGSQNGGLFKGTTASQRHYIQATLVGANVSASLSFFAKAKELRYIQIACQNTGLQYANFDIQEGVVGNVGGDFSNAKIEDYGNGWYRCSVVSTNRYSNVWVSLISGLNSNWLENWSMPNNTDGLYIYGFQTEEQSYATSYIPTNGEANGVSRNQDVCTGGGSLASINSTEGVLYFEGERLSLLGSK